MISWKSILTSLSDHLTRKAAQTYRWNSEKPFSSACEVGRVPSATMLYLERTQVVRWERG